MKQKFTTLMLAGLLTAGVVSSCSRENKLEQANENVTDAQKELDEAQEQFTKEWANFKMESEEQIRANDVEIERYRSDKTLREKYNDRIDKLETRNAEMRTRIDNYNSDNKSSNWEEFKREFKHDMDELGSAFKNLTKDNAK